VSEPPELSLLKWRNGKWNGAIDFIEEQHTLGYPFTEVVQWELNDSYDVDSYLDKVKDFNLVLAEKTGAGQFVGVKNGGKSLIFILKWNSPEEHTEFGKDEKFQNTAKGFVTTGKFGPHQIKFVKFKSID
jgi:hypothetical protein